MGFILAVHVMAAILLVITILMQAGRGGGLAESFSSAESMFGTQTNSFMVRVSTVLSIIFFCTSLTLAVSSAKGHKSLMTTSKLPAASSAQTPEPSVKVSEPKPWKEQPNEAAPAATETTKEAAPAAASTTAPVTNTAK